MQVVVRHLFISPGHNFFGRHGQAAGENAAVSVNEITCHANKGIEGDRFYGYRPDYKGQITFFSWDIYEAAKREFNAPALQPQAFRRNVLISGTDLPSLIGQRFTLGGVTFLGTEESRPCYWMNGAIAPGADQWLRGHGGLRAKILTDGQLAVGVVELAVLEPVLT